MALGAVTDNKLPLSCVFKAGTARRKARIKYGQARPHSPNPRRLTNQNVFLMFISSTWLKISKRVASATSLERSPTYSEAEWYGAIWAAAKGVKHKAAGVRQHEGAMKAFMLTANMSNNLRDHRMNWAGGTRARARARTFAWPSDCVAQAPETGYNRNTRPTMKMGQLCAVFYFMLLAKKKGS